VSTSYHSIKKDLAKAAGRTDGPVKFCKVTVIGMKLNNVVQDLDCPPIVVHSIDPQDAIPTAEQKAACLKLWAENPGAPAFYVFPADGWPSIPPMAEQTPYMRNQTGDLENEDRYIVDEEN
jgi:hypothetical protein